MTIRDEKQLAELLRDAATAHHAYEQTTGKPDANWQDWYAKHIFSNAPREHEWLALTPDVDSTYPYGAFEPWPRVSESIGATERECLVAAEIASEVRQ